jgi:hypothetical protein
METWVRFADHLSWLQRQQAYFAQCPTFSVQQQTLDVVQPATRQYQGVLGPSFRSSLCAEVPINKTKLGSCTFNAAVQLALLQINSIDLLVLPGFMGANEVMVKNVNLHRHSSGGSLMCSCREVYAARPRQRLFQGAILHHIGLYRIRKTPEQQGPIAGMNEHIFCIPASASSGTGWSSSRRLFCLNSLI